VLGLAPSATGAEVRRAFRKLALTLHPDRAGAASTHAFQRVAAAYAILSDPAARADYDRRSAGTASPAAARPHAPVHVPSPVSRAASLAMSLDKQGRLLARLSASLDTLLARAAARREGDVIELYLDERERRSGGVALIEVPVRVRCTLCGGIARPGGFWCLRCQQTGEHAELVTIYCAIRALMPDGALIVIPTDEAGGLDDLRFRIRCATSASADR